MRVKCWDTPGMAWPSKAQKLLMVAGTWERLGQPGTACMQRVWGKRQSTVIHWAWNTLHGKGKASPRSPAHRVSKCGLQPLDPALQPSQEASLEEAGIKKLHRCRDSNYCQVIHSSGEKLCSVVVIFCWFYGREHTFVHLQNRMVVNFSWKTERCLETIKETTAFPLVQPVLWIIFLQKRLSVCIQPGERCNEQLLASCLQVAEHRSELVVSLQQVPAACSLWMEKSLKSICFLKGRVLMKLTWL